MKIALLFTLLTTTSVVNAHPGGVNADGCHNNRKTGDYHCHKNSGAASARDKAPTPSMPSTPSSIVTRSHNLLKLDYEGFTVWLDCNERAAVKFRYNAQRDHGSLKRYDQFMFDPNVPRECQQYSSKAYGHGYDRGHQVPANHLDYSTVAIKQSNYMTNILPQTAPMNRGAWALIEEIVECYRDIDELLIMGGVVWGNNTEDDYFVQSHGIRTPDAFWKVVIRGIGQDERAIAWVIPNSTEATKHIWMTTWFPSRKLNS